ncbi:MAG: capsule assembly Wzi family protein [Bacteroidota bacterium]
MKNIFIAVIFCAIGTSFVYAQTVMENVHADIYEFLNRQAQKGNIVFDDLIRPISRIKITEYLDSLTVKKNHLSKIEKEEIIFFQKEYGTALAKKEWNYSEKPRFLKKDSNGRLRLLSVEKENFTLNIDPLIQMGYVKGDSQSVKKFARGIQGWATWGKHFGLNFSYADATESGTGLNPDKNFTPDQGVVLSTSTTGKSINYNEASANLYYSWKKGIVSIGQDYLLWGYGENGRMVLSDKAPVYPYFRLSLDILKWLRFEYANAVLASNVIDSNQTYFTGNPVFGGERIIYRPKYMATNTLIFKPTKGLDIAFGESVIYSDQIQIGYLLPFFYLKGYDQYSSGNRAQAGANSQIFMQISSRNQIKKTHIYGGLFIDEISMSNIFDKQKSRNQLGYSLGASITDLLIPYLTLQAEYSKINPFVYQNQNPTQNYNSNYSTMGDWMGNNADRWIVSAKYTPIPRLRLLARYQYIRKGGAGTLEQQYDVTKPQPPFLFDLQRKQGEFLLKANYEIVNNFYVTGSYSMTNQLLAPSFLTKNFKTINFGMSIGL